MSLNITTEEKIERLNKFCSGRYCSECLFYEYEDCEFDELKDSVIDDMYELAFPQEQEAPVKEAEETGISIINKRHKLDDFCDNRGSCGGCPIWIEGIAAPQECSFFSLDEEVINKMYDCVFGNETQPEPEPVTESNDLNENNEPNDVRPSHYNHNGVELIQSMIDMFGKWAVADFCKLNAIKYIYRDMEKGGATDIDKAIWYLNKYKDLVYENS